MGILPQDLTVLAGARLALISVHNEVLGPAIIPVALHKAPLESTGETGATPPPEPGLLNLVQDPVGALEHNLLGLVPVTTLEGAGQAKVTLIIQVGEDPIRILEATMNTEGAVLPPN